MTETVEEQSIPANDYAATIAFLKEFPHYVQQLSRGDIQEKFRALPGPVRRLLFNLAGTEWPEALTKLRRLGVGDEHGLESIRPLVEHFRPLASTLFEDVRTRAAIAKDYSGIDAIRPRYLFELQLRTPILHLQFLGEDEKILFESREVTADSMLTAVGIMSAVAQSFELCRERNLPLRRSVTDQVRVGLIELVEEIGRIATALNISEKELFEDSSRSNPPEGEGARNENLASG